MRRSLQTWRSHLVDVPFHVLSGVRSSSCILSSFKVSTILEIRVWKLDRSGYSYHLLSLVSYFFYWFRLSFKNFSRFSFFHISRCVVRSLRWPVLYWLDSFIPAVAGCCFLLHFAQQIAKSALLLWVRLCRTICTYYVIRICGFCLV